MSWQNILAGAAQGALSGFFGRKGQRSQNQQKFIAPANRGFSFGASWRGAKREAGEVVTPTNFEDTPMSAFDPNNIAFNVQSVSPYTKLGISAEIESFINLLKNRPTNQTERDYILQQVRGLQDSTESSYIMAALFPETESPSRFPMVFPNPTAVFKHHEYRDIFPDNAGKILIMCNPSYTGQLNNKTEPFLRIYNDYRSLAGIGEQKDAVIAPYTADRFTDVSINLFDDIDEYYQEAVLRACVLRVYYIGTVEKASGYFIGGINYHYLTGSDISVNSTPPTPDEIEDLYYKQFAKPEDGIRVVWFPKDYNDFNFRAIGSNPNQVSSLIVYGSGLDATQALRIDVIRHFEAFPLPKMKDYIETKRTDPINPANTLDALAQVSTKLPGLTTISPYDAAAAADQLRPITGGFDQVMSSLPQQTSNTSNYLSFT